MSITTNALPLVVQNWTSQAKCRNLGSAPYQEWRDLLYPAPRDNRSIAAAKRFCQDCPVALMCLRDGVDDMHSVRGGLTADERRRLREGGTIEACRQCQLPFVPRPTNPRLCTGCMGRTSQEKVVPEDLREEILTMHADGCSGEEICLQFGFTRDEIRLAAKRWQVPLMKRPKPECGTPNGARAHYRNGEKPCLACLTAARAYKAEAEARTREPAAA